MRETVIRPRRGLARLEPLEWWRFRDVLLALAVRDLKLRYRQTALGVLWVVLQPLLGALVLAFVFGRVAGLSAGGTPYVVFAFAGLIWWNVFAGTLMRCATTIVMNPQLISKVYFPRVLLPFSSEVSVLLDFCVSATVLVGLMAAYHVEVTLRLLLLPVLLLPMLAISLGAGLVLAGLAVRFRDVQYILPVGLQFLLFATPVAYSIDEVPHAFRVLVLANPIAGLISLGRWAFVGTGGVAAAPIFFAIVTAVATLVLGLLVFHVMERAFADTI